VPWSPIGRTKPTELRAPLDHEDRRASSGDLALGMRFRILLAVAVPLHQQAEAIVLDLVVPLRAGWNLGASDGDAELKRFKHVPKIGAAQKNCEIVTNINDDFPRQW